jgi:transcriptional regulator
MASTSVAATTAPRIQPGMVESVVVFQGPQSYITPSWYPGKQEHGKVVPTWNYAVVHAYGMPIIIDDPVWLRGHVAHLTSVHESEQAVPWSVSDAPSSYIDAMLQATVGIEIPVSRLFGKWKTSVLGLEATGDPESRRMAQLVQRKIEGVKG